MGFKFEAAVRHADVPSPQRRSRVSLCGYDYGAGLTER